MTPRDGVLSVLVVDDSISARRMVTATLCERDIVCEEVCDGREALDLLRSRRFDLVITDIWMPHMTGDDLVRAIRNEAGLEGLPVLAITADDTDTAHAECLDCGATGFLAKPFSSEELLAAVTRLAGR